MIGIRQGKCLRNNRLLLEGGDFPLPKRQNSTNIKTVIKRISEEQGIDQKTVALVIEGFMKCVKDALGRGRSVFLRGFGTFSLKKRAAKKAQNIQQHTTIFIPARKVPHFKPSDSFLLCREGDNRK